MSNVLRRTPGFIFEWPEALSSCIDLDDLLNSVSLTEEVNLKDETVTARKTIKHVRTRILGDGRNPDGVTHIIDCDSPAASASFSSSNMPCITRARYKGHWITSQNRRVNPTEMLRFQGVSSVHAMPEIRAKTDAQYIGNMMSLNVIERLIRTSCAQTTVGPSKESLGEDAWENGSRLQQLLVEASQCRRQNWQGFSEPKGSLTPATSASAHIQKVFMLGSERPMIVDSGASDHIVDIRLLTSQERENPSLNWPPRESLTLLVARSAQIRKSNCGFHRSEKPSQRQFSPIDLLYSH